MAVGLFMFSGMSLKSGLFSEDIPPTKTI